jgi:hypothetical protein
VVDSGRLPRDGATLRRMALAYPEAYEEMPWGHHAITSLLGWRGSTTPVRVADGVRPRAEWLGDGAVSAHNAAADRHSQTVD